MEGEAIHSEEFSMGASHGKTNMLWFLMRALMSEFCKFARPAKTLKMPHITIQSEILRDLRLSQIKVDQQHRAFRLARNAECQISGDHGFSAPSVGDVMPRNCQDFMSMDCKICVRNMSKASSSESQCRGL